MKSLSREELIEKLKHTGIEPHFAKEQASKLLGQGAAAVSLELFSILRNHPEFKNWAMPIAQNYIWKLFYQKGTQLTLKKIAQKLPQKALPRALGWIGIALLAKEAYDLGGEATRITVPFVVIVSIHRTIEHRLSQPHSA
jgi:hypothetical protein